jgi:hypothetical protein
MAAASSPIMMVGAWVQAFSAAGMIEASSDIGADDRPAASDQTIPTQLRPLEL